MSHTVDPFVYCEYTTDAEVSEGQIKMHASVATAISATPEALGAHKPVIQGKERRKCRYVRARNQASPYNIIQVAIPTADNATFAMGETITWRDSATYKVIGLYGEVENSVNRR
jgi:hypothetical protein